MATDFSINALLNLPSKESRNVPEQKIKVELPISGTERFFPPVGQIDSNGICESLSREPTSYLRKSHPKASPSIDLTRFPAADFTTIVIPKKHTKARRKRTAFSNIQLHFLEQFFQKKAYPSSQERNFIGSILNIGSGQVKTWYQNRRTKMKKNKVFDFGIEARESTVTSTLEGNVNRLGNNQLPTIATVSRLSTLESNIKCFDFGNKQPYIMSMASLNGKTSLPEMHCDCYKPTCIGSNLLLQQQSMIGQHL